MLINPNKTKRQDGHCRQYLTNIRTIKKKKSARFLMALVTRNFFLSCLFKIDQISSMERERERIRNWCAHTPVICRSMINHQCAHTHGWRFNYDVHTSLSYPKNNRIEYLLEIWSSTSSSWEIWCVCNRQKKNCVLNN
jgi:hypothetical protein